MLFGAMMFCADAVVEHRPLFPAVYIVFVVYDVIVAFGCFVIASLPLFLVWQLR